MNPNESKVHEQSRRQGPSPDERVCEGVVEQGSGSPTVGGVCVSEGNKPSGKQTTPESGFSFFSQGSRAAHVGRSAGCFLESEVNNVMDKQFVRPGRVADVSLERMNGSPDDNQSCLFEVVGGGVLL